MNFNKKYWLNVNLPNFYSTNSSSKKLCIGNKNYKICWRNCFLLPLLAYFAIQFNCECELQFVIQEWHFRFDLNPIGASSSYRMICEHTLRVLINDSIILNYFFRTKLILYEYCIPHLCVSRLQIWKNLKKSPKYFWTTETNK